MGIVTLTTDFGSLYPASMKGVILSIDENAKIVDISHSIPQADIRAAAFALFTVVEYFPKGTVHIAVVDPGVGTDRKAIVIHSGGHYFVGPDNGLMMPAARKLGKIDVFEIGHESLPDDISATFHGRDVFARVGAHIVKGLDVQKLAHGTDDFVDLAFHHAHVSNDVVSAEVLYIDDFGNIVINVPAEVIMGISSFGTTFDLDGMDVPFMDTYARTDPGSLLFLVGSHGYLELAINQGNAAQMLGLHNGARMSITLPIIEKSK
ncbi:SAM-dependent chlorinase/fluorinase [Methanolobus sp. ZRKC3]|uniref:SAM hydrolase/SAM-dependent halogenase family protein n=1 Tax=Methanolobus sp. ZRKC3 TaxID=3125786 RepID=UPI0032568A23